jgi:hypothetical protein
VNHDTKLMGAVVSALCTRGEKKSNKFPTDKIIDIPSREKKLSMNLLSLRMLFCDSINKNYHQFYTFPHFVEVFFLVAREKSKLLILKAFFRRTVRVDKEKISSFQCVISLHEIFMQIEVRSVRAYAENRLRDVI